MLTNNYYLIQEHYAVKGYTTTVEQPIAGTKSTDGQEYHFFGGASWGQGTNLNGSPRAGLSIVLGEGNTAPALTDYCLEDDVTSSLNLSCVVNTGSDGGALKTVLTVSGINTTGSEITIKEFGIVKSCVLYSNSYMYQSKPFLYARELLRTPKVVGAGEPFTLTFEWSGS